MLLRDSELVDLNALDLSISLHPVQGETMVLTISVSYSTADAPVLNVNETAHTQGAIFTPTISARNSHIDIPVMTQLPNNQNLST